VRALLLLITAVCLWFGLAYRSAKRQERAVDAIEKGGGRVSYEWQYR
jgi:hypothetical protein